MMSKKSAPGSAGAGDRYVKGITCALRSLVSLFEGGDIQIHCGEVVEHHLRGWTALKFSKSFNVTKTTLAGVDHRIRATFLRHERNKLLMVVHAAVWAEQT